MNQSSIPAVWMRGGTSKGLFLLAGDLPNYERDRDKVICRILGSPDLNHKQIDGIGGGSSSTSLVSIISETDKPGFDLEYISGNVSVDTDVIDYTGFSANLAAAVGVYAVEQGFVLPQKNGPFQVRILQSNIDRKILVDLEIEDGQPVIDGEFAIDGVPGSGAPLKVNFIKPGLGKISKVLPTGNSVDQIDVPGFGVIEASLIAAGGNTIFVRAADFGLRGTEFAKEIETNRELMNLLELIRCIGAVQMRVSPSIEFARSHQPASPKIALISPAQAYISSRGQTIAAEDQSFCGRLISTGKVHHAFTGTAAIAASVAARVSHSIVAEAFRESGDSTSPVKIGHPGGLFEVESDVELKDGFWIAEKATITRTARTLMIGEAFYKKDAESEGE